MDKSIDLSSKIQGWGADLDPSRRPAYPKEKTPPHGTGAHWTEPDQQVPRVHINQSLEHNHLTPVFGTTLPPKGLSGVMRNFAYENFSEGDMRHWLTLLAADRVDVMEGLLQDFAHASVPNIFKERGLGALLKHNPRLFQKRMAVTLGVLTFLAGTQIILRQRAKRLALQ